MSSKQIPSTKQLERKQIEIEGYVQGIGFRPFLFRLANKHNLTGFVKNISGKVYLEIQGDKQKIEKFISDINVKKPPLAKIKSLKIKKINAIRENTFQIKESQKIEFVTSNILPDIAICKNCQKEILDPSNRRYLYPFINCTDCGPRYTIIFDHPYDRIHTSMNSFPMCEDCRKEYEDPFNRRFHAEPISCLKCGPEIILISRKDIIDLKAKIKKEKQIDYHFLFKTTAELLKKGNILAIKGLGGYHICCSIDNKEVLQKLRIRKKRKYKPFAVMFPNIETIRSYCYLDPKEEELLLSYETPIVLLKLKKNVSVPEEINPGQNFLGVFLPYTPIHYLLMHFYKKPLIMTSANFSNEPIIYKDDWEQLFQIADYVLYHNREIVNYCDDSVVSKSKYFTIFNRQGRGYTPKCFDFDSKTSILGLGAELKNTIAITNKNQIIISPYIGDLENIETWEHHFKTIELFKKIYYLNPEYIAVDYHPNFRTTRWAQENFSTNKIIYVQHHHAHIVSCMFENQIQEPVLGIALDGVGFGTTKNHPSICGAEIYFSTYKEFKHLGSIHPIGLIGGDKATKEIKRIGFTLIYEVYKKFFSKYNFKDFIKEFYSKLILEDIDYYEQLLLKNLQFYKATSCGRLFDGVSYLLGLCEKSDYEGHPAILLEQSLYTFNKIKLNNKNIYNYKIYKNPKNQIYYLDWRFIIKDILMDLKEKKHLSIISQKFHNTLVSGFLEILNLIKVQTRIKKVVLTGGCFQNRYLLDNFYESLLKQDYKVYFHKNLSPNDENISIGQILVANAILSN
ncbi:MAG: carbamoyltransferase HypF [Leptonema sp. (in: bacteria)]